jgi:hypothetical protein
MISSPTATSSTVANLLTVMVLKVTARKVVDGAKRTTAALVRPAQKLPPQLCLPVLSRQRFRSCTLMTTTMAAVVIVAAAVATVLF